MRRWRSKKIVQAEQIMSYTTLPDNTISLQLSSGENVQVDRAWTDKHSDGKGFDKLVLGWFVVYPDGYRSWHPDGYMDTHERVE